MTSNPVTEGQDAIGLCLAGRISPEVAIARLLLGGATAESLVDEFEARRPSDADSDALRRWSAAIEAMGVRHHVLNGLAAQIAANGSDHTSLARESGISGVAAFFDTQVAHSPEASVALYSLADPAILAASTAEIVDWIGAEGLLDRDADVADIGCGIGRISAALAPRCRSVLGLDVSAGMIAEARRRCAGMENVSFAVTQGENLDTLPSQGFDLVLAVDSFPYIVQAGGPVVDGHLAGAGRALRSGRKLGDPEPVVPSRQRRR